MEWGRIEGAVLGPNTAQSIPYGRPAGVAKLQHVSTLSARYERIMSRKGGMLRKPPAGRFAAPWAAFAAPPLP